AKLYAAAAEHILRQSGIDRGYCLVYGFGRGQLAWELARRSGLTVIGVEEDAEKADEARRLLLSAGAYGTRIVIHQVKSLSELPLPPCFANLVVSEAAMSSGKLPGSAAEIFRVLRPAGGTVLLGSPAGAPNPLKADELKSYLKAGGMDTAVSSDGGTWAAFRRPALEGSADWSHQYGTPANAAYAGETLAGATKTADMRLQWVGRPGADFGIDRQVRMPAPVSGGGKLYHEGMQKLVAMDAYNGTILWLMEIPDLMRVNIPRDASNVCADENNLYVALRDRCLVLDGQTGLCKAALPLPESVDPKTHDWGYVACVGDTLFGTAMKKGSAYTDWWGAGAWYDSPAGGGTHKVCGVMLFACDKATGKTRWVYNSGVVPHPTIAIADGRVHFIEVRDESLKNQPGSRFGRALYSNRHLVALDAKTGKTIWDRPLNEEKPGSAAYYLSCGGGRVVVLASATLRYHIFTYNAKDGTPGWTTSFSTFGDNHGAHMKHPIVTDKIIYQRPFGFDLQTGKQLTDKMPSASCGTYAASSGAMIFRGRGMISFWDTGTGQVTYWKYLRPSCWLSAIPSGGMLLAPEGGGGCSCGGWIETSVGFLPAATGSPAQAKGGAQ
ncbi:MAG TPA: PQQ-binding-like beta-propeller repeat protein, partial [Phycisphaerae bacterium]|nr:PQQ-binding-like beta-propeller repeat protein [Phycisphaerae bacterium]